MQLKLDIRCTDAGVLQQLEQHSAAKDLVGNFSQEFDKGTPLFVVDCEYVQEVAL